MEQQPILDGIFLLDKKVNDTSMYAVNMAKEYLKLKKAGHTGTLDPFASGLLMICANDSTKTLQVFQSLPKVYEAVFVFGEEKDTDDITGKTLQTSSKVPDLQEIQDILPVFTGKIEQVPPQYSAVWVDGERAFNLKRSGKEVQLKSKKIEIHEYSIIYYMNKELKVRINCSSGSYIRALARDLGRILGTYAYVKELKRLSIGDFSLQHAKAVEEISENDMIPLKESLSFIPAYKIKEEFLVNVSNAVPVRDEFFTQTGPELEKDYFYTLQSPSGNLLALLKGSKYYYIRKGVR